MCDERIHNYLRKGQKECWVLQNKTRKMLSHPTFCSLIQSKWSRIFLVTKGVLPLWHSKHWKCKMKNSWNMKSCKYNSSLLHWKKRIENKHSETTSGSFISLKNWNEKQSGRQKALWRHEGYSCQCFECVFWISG